MLSHVRVEISDGHRKAGERTCDGLGPVAPPRLPDMRIFRPGHDRRMTNPAQLARTGRHAGPLMHRFTNRSLTGSSSERNQGSGLKQLYLKHNPIVCAAGLHAARWKPGLPTILPTELSTSVHGAAQSPEIVSHDADLRISEHAPGC